MANNRTCQLKIKGSPTSQTWYGERGSPTADGYVCLLRLPDSCPLAKLPNRYQIPDKIVKSLSTPKMTAFFNEHGRSKAHEDLVTMATTFAVPCIRRATEQDLAGLTLSERAALDGFANVQVIGAEGEVTAVVPFLVDEFLQSNHAFWRTPPGTLHARPAQLDRPISRFGYKTKKRKEPSQGSQEDQEVVEEKEEDQKNLESDQIPPDSPDWQAATPVWQPDWQSQQDQDLQADLDRKHDDESDPVQGDDSSPLPKDWGASMADAHIGTLAVCQVAYGALSDNHIGVSVVEVPHLIYFHLTCLMNICR